MCRSQFAGRSRLPSLGAFPTRATPQIARIANVSGPYHGEPNGYIRYALLLSAPPINASTATLAHPLPRRTGPLTSSRQVTPIAKRQPPIDRSIARSSSAIITPASESTSVLSDGSLLVIKKTRAMAAWAERRGFTTAIHERLFDAGCRRQAVEPSVVFCGLDNALGRRVLDDAGFDFVVEAGLGRGHRDFRTIRLHTLPGTKPATELWKVREPEATYQGKPRSQWIHLAKNPNARIRDHAFALDLLHRFPAPPPRQ